MNPPNDRSPETRSDLNNLSLDEIQAKADQVLNDLTGVIELMAAQLRRDADNESR